MPPVLRLVLVVAVVAVLAAGCGKAPPPAVAPAQPGDPVTRFVPDADDPDAPATVWAVGDAEPRPAARRLARRIAADQPARLLYTGDVYETGTAEEFARNYDPLYGELKNITAPTPGNHEWPNHRTGYDPYWARAHGGPTPPWYDFRIGGWRIVSLNSEAPHGRGSRQQRFARRALAGAGTCRMVMMHSPRFSASPKHGDVPGMEPLFALMPGQAALLVSGHDHNLQLLKRRRGVTQVVSGAGGRERYRLNRADPRLVYGNDRVAGAVRMTLRPGRADLAFVAGDGRVMHRSTVRCRTGA